MPGPLYHVGNVTSCMHGGLVQEVPTSPVVLVNGMPVGVGTDPFMIAGCPFVVGGVPQPCLTVTWVVPSVALTSMGKPLLLQISTGTTNGPTMAPQGAPLVSVNQPTVSGT